MLAIGFGLGTGNLIYDYPQHLAQVAATISIIDAIFSAAHAINRAIVIIDAAQRPKICSLKP